MSKHANSPFKKLPPEALQNIKGFYSDRYAPHPTAEMIRKLKFKYCVENILNVYLPARLCVSEEQFFKIFYLSDFTSDRYEQESMKKSNFKIGRPVTLYGKFGYDFKEDIQNRANVLGMPLDCLEYYFDFERQNGS